MTRARRLARHPAAWLLLAAVILLIACGLVWAPTVGPGCVPHNTPDGRPVVTCPHRP